LESKNGYSIRKLESSDLPEALHLVWQTFQEFEAPDYSAEGVKEFHDFIASDSIKNLLSKSELFIWGAFDHEKIIGVIASRPPCHITLLFVDKNYHRKGVARTLHNTIIDHYKMKSEHLEMTVNSSPYAVEAYRRLGFTETNTEQVVNGIRFIPMKHIFR